MFASLGVLDYWTYLLGTLFIVLLPGPNSLYVLATGARRGVAAGYRAACGVFLGDSLLMLLAALGMASVLKSEPWFFLAIKYAGAAYLLWLGIGMLRGGWRGLRHPAQGDAVTPEPADLGQPFRKALLLSLANPKAILFFVSFFIQFVDPAAAHPGPAFLVLATTLQVLSFCYLSFLIFAGARLAHWFRRQRRLAAGATGGVGALFVGFGIKLAAASMS